MSTPKLQVECMECGKRFRTASMLPKCPKCGGTDIDIANAADVPVEWTTKTRNPGGAS